MNYKNAIRSLLNLLHLDLTKNLEYDRLTKAIMKQEIRPSSNCIDIGCHKGEMLEILLRLAPSGQHYAFEPLPFMFKDLKKNPVIMRRVNYLELALKNVNSEDNKEFSESIILFSLFIEHVSLFSQFLIIMAFNKHKNVLKGISNVVEATSKEEQIHGDFGIDLIKIIKEENPDWFDEANSLVVQETCKEAFLSESKIIDWIFEKGELDFLPKAVIKEFIKNRFNNSLESIGVPKIFDIDQKLLSETDWFDDEIIGTKHGDFFVKRSINYSKRTKSITSDDLF